MYKVFGDPGYGYTKFIDNRGNEVLRPSVHSTMPSGLNGTELGIESEYGSFLFGESAQNLSAMTRQFRDYRDCLSNVYAANVLMAIAEMNKGNIVDCELVISLPFEALHLQFDLMKHLAGEHKIKRLGYHKQTINISFPPKWGVMPQNAAPVFATLNLKDIKKDGEIWFAVGNIGSKTFEMGTFGIDPKRFALLPGVLAQQKTEQKGMYTLANDIRSLLIKTFRDQLTDFSQHDIFNILISGTVWVGNQEVDVAEVIGPKKQEYLEAIHNYCEQLWTRQNGREILNMYQLCISGGGAHIVVPYLREMNYHNNIVVSQEPQFDVCVGSMNYHKSIGDKR